MTEGQQVRIESLFFNLKELQNEKACVEQKLHEVKLKRHSLEQEIEHAASKCSHAQDKHRRMSEILAVARQKVEQTMATSLSLQADIEQSRPKLDQLQDAIEAEKKLQLLKLEEFETSLLGMSSQLFSARDFYKNSNLQNEINSTQKAHMELEQQVYRENKNVENLTTRLEKLTQSEQSSALIKSGIEESLYICCRVMERDEEDIRADLSRIQDELQEIREIIHCVE
ncbi:unnamed protein product [Candidula unifasciata]|uniref:Uncharacterized protein n=1 Tax=Candidula unifasciata TaxID=100452 RepID=A0A8S4A475_9EUPU|nr:unnamed protein product [Candidula unifasciata]